MLRRLCFILLVPLLSAAAFAGEDDELILLEEGRLYRTVNGEAISGKDVVDLLVEENWERDLQLFIEHALIEAEVQNAKITVADAEVDAELKRILEEYARRAGLDPKTLVPDKALRHAGLPGTLGAIRRQIRDNLGLHKLLVQDKKLPAGAALMGKEFQAAVQEHIEKLSAAKGIVRDRKTLGAGEAVRIAGRGYSRDEVRAFIAEGLRQLPQSELKQKLELLELEKIVQKELADKKIELNESDLNFHFSFLCRLMEAQHRVPGRTAMQQTLQRNQMTAEQFMQSRPFKVDAGLTRLAKDPIRAKHIKKEFADHPERYKRSENLIAHILIRVLDPDGRPYTAAWKVSGHDAVQAYAAKRREEQFEKMKPKIEGLVALAKENFDETAKKYSEDSITAPVGGTIGRIGAETIMVPPCDMTVRDAALKLKPGELSAPVRSDYGWHLIKCLDKQDVTLDEAAERIYMTLIHDSKRTLHETLKKNAKIEEKN